MINCPLLCGEELITVCGLGHGLGGKHAASADVLTKLCIVIHIIKVTPFLWIQV